MIVFATVLLPSLAQAQGLADLVNPDDIMLRKPAQPAADQAAQKAAAAQAAAEAQARAAAEALAAERKARAEAEAKARAEAEAKARAEVEAKAAAELKAREEAAATQRQAQDEAAELKRLQAQIAAEKKAREEAAARAAAAERAVVAAQKAQAEAEAARVQAERRVQSEQAARAEAEAKAAVDRQAADAAIEQAQAAAREKAEAEKAKLAAEKKAERLANPDPDERPVVKEPKAKLEAPVTDDAAAEQTPAAAEPATKQTVKTKKQLTGRPAVITADRTDYDRKEGVILFDRNVHLDDEQYQMHADRVFVFLSGTNDLKRIVALGSVSITNEAKTAACAKAVYSREQQRIVMYAENDQQPAWLRDAGSKEGDESEVAGRRITYWLDSGLFSVEGPVVRFHGMKGADSPKDLFNPTRAHKEKAVKAEDEGK